MWSRFRWKTLVWTDRIWDVRSRDMLTRLPAHDGHNDVGPGGVAISPIDGNLIATECPEGVRICDRGGNQIDEIADTGGTP